MGDNAEDTWENNPAEVVEDWMGVAPTSCESGLNTFVLNESCLDSTIDLLEGWGAAKPDYKWVGTSSQTPQTSASTEALT